MSVTQIQEIPFGQLSGNEVKLFKIKNKNDFELNVISYGASIQSILVKDKNNQQTNVVLGFETIEEYSNSALNPYFGCAVGRVANRISNAEFKLNDVTYKLEKNNGNHCLHSGSTGISMKNWATDLVENGVKFSYLSPSGEGGFPGEVLIEAIYTVDPSENKIMIQYNVVTDIESTPINLTNHAYFNLAGDNSKTKIYEHDLKLNSNKYLDFNPVDVTVTGKINEVKDTKYDFREFQKLGDRIKFEGEWPTEGYDNFFVINGEENQMRKVATVKNKSNGLVLDLESNQNGVQFYTGNFLNVKKLNGHNYSTHEGFCLETHNYPDSVNIVEFPGCILSPEGEYSNTTILSFTIEK